ncbi:MAG: alpha-glucosidase/alpha-galactosidase [Chloroflexi bacterium]|nr:alpha-glucosidase/alpha-galactosidase [Chloroflexota bacterium]
MKIAYIGGGSREWARKLMFDLALCPDLEGHVALYDLDLESAQLNAELGNWLQTQRGVVSRWQYAAVAARSAALAGADFVVVSIQPGSLQVMADEIAIAEKYGLFFPVGDTTGAPGLIRGLRAATIYAEFARAIAAECPRAWVINYTNPMTICTRTLTRVAPELKVFGCCHEVFSTQEYLARLIAARLGGDPPPRHEIQINVLGINHFTFVDRAFYQEHDLLALLRAHLAEPDVLRPFTRAEVEAGGNWFQDNRQVKWSLFQRLGILPAAGDRHLVEFLPGYVVSPEELFRWGVIRTPASYRIQRWRDAMHSTRDLIAGRSPLELRPSGEEGVQQIRALLGLGDWVTNVSVENVGQIGNLPHGAVVETNALFTRDQVLALPAGALPPSIHSLIARHVANQEMIVQAALTGDKEMAFHAVYNDPASGLTVDRAWSMFEEMLEASRAYLPHFTKSN